VHVHLVLTVGELCCKSTNVELRLFLLYLKSSEQLFFIISYYQSVDLFVSCGKQGKIRNNLHQSVQSFC